MSFTDRARAEAERRTRPPGISGQTLPSMEQFAEQQGYRRGFVDCAEWAASQEPTDAEVEAALTALLISESIALGQTADEAADYAIRELEARDLTNLRTGVRCALTAAREAKAR